MGIGVGHAFFCQSVNVWGRNFACRVKARYIAVAEVVAHHENDVGLVGKGRGKGIGHDAEDGDEARFSVHYEILSGIVGMYET